MQIFIAVVIVAGGMWSHLLHADDLYQEQFRPQYHFSPPQQWLNDPNGMVYFDGEYHLFYQHHPHSNLWGPMHWGHTVSKDMVNWKNLPIALFPDRQGQIFSGSAVVDWNNTSGFGSIEKPPLVAVFTYHNDVAENLGQSDFQTQGIAYSVDKGRTWTKYAGNPVVKNPGVRDFRDPKVFWFEPQRKWIMTLAIADHVSFYSSKDMKSWSHESDFGREWGAHGGVWECPDLVDMKIEGEGTRKFVLIVSINPGGPNGGSGTQYFIGTFDGSRFVLDADLQEKLTSDRSAQAETARASWLDYGTDNYAGVTWSGLPAADGRRLFIGWMSNWEYARKVPSERWRGAVTIPRELKLIRTERGLEVHSVPTAELEALRVGKRTIAKRQVRQEVDLTQLAGRKTGLLEMALDLQSNDAELIEVAFRNSKKEQTVLRINKKERRYELDRSASGVVGFSDLFARVQTAPLWGAGENVALRIYLDHSSIEIFVNGGAVFTALVFPQTPYDTVALKADEAIELKSATLYELRGIWDKRATVSDGPRMRTSAGPDNAAD